MTKVFPASAVTERERDAPLPLFSYLEEEERRAPLLFVCEGGVCRSPMAAAAVNGLSPYKERYFAFCAGLSPLPGERMPEAACAALRELGILPCAENDYPAHTAREVVEADLARARRVFCFTREQSFLLAMRHPALASKVEVFPRAVPDPYGRDIAAFRAALAAILNALPALLLGEEGGGIPGDPRGGSGGFPSRGGSGGAPDDDLPLGGEEGGAPGELPPPNKGENPRESYHKEEPPVAPPPAGEGGGARENKGELP